MDLWLIALGFGPGLLVGALGATALTQYALLRGPKLKGTAGRVQAIARAAHHAREEAAIDERARKREARQIEAEDWVQAFEDANPGIDMSTPEGIALAEELVKQEKLPRYVRRMLGLSV